MLVEVCNNARPLQSNELMSRKALVFISAAAFSLVVLAGCKEDALDTVDHEPTREHCQPDHLKTLPDNKARVDLVEKCMSSVNAASSGGVLV